MRYDEDYVAGLKARISELEEALDEAAHQRKWTYLTEEEMLDIVDTYGMPLAEAIEAKLRGKNT